MKKGNKGQISYFMLIVIVIGTIFSFFFYLNAEEAKTPEIEKVSSFTLDAKSVKIFVESCMEVIGKTGLSFIGLQGGYYKTESLRSINYFGGRVPFYFYLGEELMPSKQFIENEFSSFMIDNLNSCVDDFSVFKEQGFTVETTLLNVSSIIRENDVLVKINYPVALQKGEIKWSVSDFSAKIPSRLDDMYGVILDLMEEQNEESNFVLLHKIIDLGLENRLTWELDYRGNTVVYLLIDELPNFAEFPSNKTEIKIEEPKIFSFAIRYDWVVTDEDFINIVSIPDQTAYVGEEFMYHVTVNSTNAKFSDLSLLLDITDNGIIQFTPTADDIGTHHIIIKASNRAGNEDFELMRLIVETR